MKLPFLKLKKKLQSQLTIATNLTPVQASPDELLGELFQDVQLRRIHADSKTFTDLIPEKTLSAILKEYARQRLLPGFDLHHFVERYFKGYLKEDLHTYVTNPSHTPKEHINELWDLLKRETYKNSGSLIALPYPYIVPGGRFNEQFYWDTYFVMLGLARAGRVNAIDDMMKNYAFMIRKFGYIPTANRTYLTSRSQPPFFVLMVRLLAEKKGKSILVWYLPYLLAEYSFWRKGVKELDGNTPAIRRVVRMPDGTILNRYYDNKRTPRPEAYKEDLETASEAKDRIPSQVFSDLRAGAESGWDFSSRWFKDGENLHTIHTTELIPVDLNCLLYQLEQTIGDIYRLLKQPILAKRYKERAEKRAATIRTYCWSEQEGFYFDYDFVAGEQSKSFTLAAAYPLFAKIASQEEAKAVAHVLETRFLKEGGLLTTLADTGEQWDAPNGWAPLQWIAIQGLRNYGYNDLANEIKKRWVEANLIIYKTSGKMVEKYNVVDPINGNGGGGEYPLQDGFGWTNGVLLALLTEDN